MAIKHKNPTRNNRKARAPYNFVPVPDRVLTFPAGLNKNPLQSPQNKYHTGKLTGWIDLEITTKSPVFIRAGMSPEDYTRMEQQEQADKIPHLDRIKNRPEFYYTDHPSQPVIPGSSLRGMFRNLSQIVSFGKLAPVVDKPEIYRAVGDTSSHGIAYREQMMAAGDESGDLRNPFIPKMKGGFMRFVDGEGWYIEPAPEYQGASHGRIEYEKTPKGLNRWEGCRNASVVYIQPTANDYQEIRGHINIKRPLAGRAFKEQPGGYKKAVIAKTGKMNKKKSEAYIYVSEQKTEKSKNWIRIPDGIWNDDDRDLVTDYKEQISVEQANLLGGSGVLKDFHPVFYLMEENKKSQKNELVFFGHGPLFRIPYKYSPKEMLDSIHYNDHRIDFTEALFGKANSNRDAEEATTGRVFFEDAPLENLGNGENPWMPNQRTYIAKILNSPKPTTFQHYLVQTDPDADRGRGLNTYNNPKKTTLRGFKMYWHKPDVSAKDFEEQDDIDRKQDKVHTQIKPVREGVTFKGRIRFENLIPLELGILLYVAQLSHDDNHCHKIGMGKPLGLGAIQIKSNVTIFDISKRYKTFFTTGQELELEEGRSGVSVEDAVTEALSNFEKFMTKNSGYAGKRLDEVPRIQMLKKMMTFSGPNKDWTRYMEIERYDPTSRRGKRNEYRERPVLPTPLKVDS